MSDAVSWSRQNLPSQSGRIAVVTGANSGLGLEITRGLAALGARVVMACRDAGRAEAARADVLRTVPEARLDVRLLDLADLGSVQAFAEVQGEPVDLLVNNAGVMALRERRTTADGFEAQMGVNVLGAFALTARLLPGVEDTAGRVVWVTSALHKGATLDDLADLQSERSYDPVGAYNTTKLADLMLAVEMQRRLAAAGMRAESVAAHPGFAATNLSSGLTEGSPLKAAVFAVINRVVAIPAWKGALPLLSAAADPDVPAGGYVGPSGFRELRGDPGPAEASPAARDAEAAARLWEVCERLTGASMLPAST